MTELANMDNETEETETFAKTKDQKIGDVTVAMETEPVVKVVRVDSAQAEAGQ